MPVGIVRVASTLDPLPSAHRAPGRWLRDPAQPREDIDTSAPRRVIGIRVGAMFGNPMGVLVSRARSEVPLRAICGPYDKSGRS
jgi:hypothetical protein